MILVPVAGNVLVLMNGLNCDSTFECGPRMACFQCRDGFT